MKTHTIYRNHNSNDFGSQPTFIDKDISVVDMIEVTMIQHKNRCALFVGSKDVMYYCEFRPVTYSTQSCQERCEHWFNTIALKWQEVTVSCLEACDFKRVET